MRCPPDAVALCHISNLEHQRVCERTRARLLNNVLIGLVSVALCVCVRGLPRLTPCAAYAAKLLVQDVRVTPLSKAVVQVLL